MTENIKRRNGQFGTLPKFEKFIRVVHELLFREGGSLDFCQEKIRVVQPEIKGTRSATRVQREAEVNNLINGPSCNPVMDKVLKEILFKDSLVKSALAYCHFKNQVKTDIRSIKVFVAQLLESDVIQLKWMGPGKGFGIIALKDIKTTDTIPISGTGNNGPQTAETIVSLIEIKNASAAYIKLRGKIAVFDGPAYFLNHSCQPNCVVQFNKAGKLVKGIKPRNDIGKGEELTISYGEQYFKSKNMKCLCDPCLNE